MKARIVSIRPTPVALRVNCRVTVEQQRKMFLAMNPAFQEQLAEEWRLRHERAHTSRYVDSLRDRVRRDMEAWEREQALGEAQGEEGER